MSAAWLLTLTVSTGSAFAQSATPIIFDDFNVSEFHFGYAPDFSGTSSVDNATSTADRIEDETMAKEGVGFQQLFLHHNGTDTTFRTRHLSGGNPGPTPPGTPVYNSANAASIVGNTGFAFTTSEATDGFIGFYARTTATGWETNINLDGAGGTAADMEASPSTPLIADGEWHHYEWDLDSETDWGVVPHIGGGGPDGALTHSSHTIDSIYFRDLDGELGPDATIDLDFVALNPNGSIADLLGPPPPGDDADFDADGDVDGADFLAWQRGLGDDTAELADGDANDDGKVDGADLEIWKTQFTEGQTPPPPGLGAASAVPEPASMSIAAIVLLAGLGLVRRRPS
jgi:hypothetical protein